MCFRNQKKENELANMMAQWRKAEATLSSKEAEVTQLLSENHRLKDDFTDMQSRLEQVKTAAAAGHERSPRLHGHMKGAELAASDQTKTWIRASSDGLHKEIKTIMAKYEAVKPNAD